MSEEDDDQIDIDYIIEKNKIRIKSFNKPIIYAEYLSGFDDEKVLIDYAKHKESIAVVSENLFAFYIYSEDGSIETSFLTEEQRNEILQKLKKTKPLQGYL